jgi:nicotinamide mononucleotide (NMN) deamidase PncC
LLRICEQLFLAYEKPIGSVCFADAVGSNPQRINKQFVPVRHHRRTNAVKQFLKT